MLCRRCAAAGPCPLSPEEGCRRGVETYCLCVFCVGPLCGPPLRWWVLCGVLPSVWVPCGWGPPLSCSRFPWHLFLVLPLAGAHALAVISPSDGSHGTQVGLHTILPLPTLYGVWHTKGGSGGGRKLCNSRAKIGRAHV